LTIPKGTKIIVKVEDLSNSSHALVDVECDICGRKIKSILWRDYKKYIKKDGKYHCNKCNGNRLTRQEIRRIIDEKLGMKWEIIEIKIIKNNNTYSTLIDDAGYWYENVFIYGIQNGSIPDKFHKSNKYTKHNINHYCKLNNINIRLISNYKGANKKLKWECLDCGNIFKRNWCNIQQGEISCSNCSDGISYPNKFIMSLFNQLNEEYIPEYSPDWAYIEHNNSKLNGVKIYDFNLINKNEIWEVHGLQHYEEHNWSKYGGRTLKEEQENDRIKKELAEKNGFKYIVVDARYSELEYIKNSILNLPEIHKYDLSLIDWLKCHEFAMNSLVKEVCNLWCDGIKNTLEISKIIKLGRTTIIKYLKQGAKLDWCNYNSKEIMKKVWKDKEKPIIQLSLSEKYIAEFESINKAKRQLNINNSSISACCRDNAKTTGGFKWMYKEDYEKYRSNKEE